MNMLLWLRGHLLKHQHIVSGIPRYYSRSSHPMWVRYRYAILRYLCLIYHRANRYTKESNQSYDIIKHLVKMTQWKFATSHCCLLNVLLCHLYTFHHRYVFSSLELSRPVTSKYPFSTMSFLSCLYRIRTYKCYSSHVAYLEPFR